MYAVPSRLDHLVYATPDLDAEVERLERELGVRPVAGGEHPEWETRNALIALGPGRYMEVIGPVREGARPRLFGIASLNAPRLVTWAAKATALGALAERARAHGIELGEPRRGERRRADGSLLTWKLTDPLRLRCDGLLPFFIDWGNSLHPAANVFSSLELIDFHGEHPEPRPVRAQLVSLGVDLRVEEGPAPMLVALLRTPTGVISLS